MPVVSQGHRESAAQPTETAPVWSMEIEEVLGRLETRVAGLDPAEAARRLRVQGPNRLPEKPPRSAWAVLASQFKGFLNVLLLIAAAIAWAVGDLKDAL